MYSWGEQLSPIALLVQGADRIGIKIVEENMI